MWPSISKLSSFLYLAVKRKYDKKFLKIKNKQYITTVGKLLHSTDNDWVHVSDGPTAGQQQKHCGAHQQPVRSHTAAACQLAIQQHGNDTADAVNTCRGSRCARDVAYKNWKQGRGVGREMKPAWLAVYYRQMDKLTALMLQHRRRYHGSIGERSTGPD